MTNIRHLVIGNGYLGSRLCRLFPADSYCASHRVTPVHAGQELLALDINVPESWACLQQLTCHPDMVVYLLVPPSRIDIAVLPDFLACLDRLPAKRRILASSTVVYGQEERVVDADSEVMLDSERGQRQYAVEQTWIQAGKLASVVRFAGLYGPGRVVGLQGVRTNQVVDGDADAWLNLVHVDDAAVLMQRIGELPEVATYELGCDGVPLRRRNYYGMLAELLHVPAPRFAAKDVANSGGRRCSNALTVARTGWSPRHTDIRQSVSAILSETA